MMRRWRWRLGEGEGKTATTMAITWTRMRGARRPQEGGRRRRAFPRRRRGRRHSSLRVEVSRPSRSRTPAPTSLSLLDPPLPSPLLAPPPLLHPKRRLERGNPATHGTTTRAKTTVREGCTPTRIRREGMAVAGQTTTGTSTARSLSAVGRLPDVVASRRRRLSQARTPTSRTTWHQRTTSSPPCPPPPPQSSPLPRPSLLSKLNKTSPSPLSSASASSSGCASRSVRLLKARSQTPSSPAGPGSSAPARLSSPLDRPGR